MITLVPAKPADVGAIASLLSELDEYYGGERVEPSTELVRLIDDAIFGPNPAGHVLLAWDDDRLVGLASYSSLWPAARVTRSIYLKELYVVEQSRQHGIGRLLMSELSRIALASGCSRVEWTADTDNPTAQRPLPRFDSAAAWATGSAAWPARQTTTAARDHSLVQRPRP